MRGIAAALLGMTCVEPGKPNLPGAFAGVAIIGLLGNALVLAGAPYYTQDILLGVVIVAAVAASARRLPKAAFAVK
jgi:ribose transport system permease protein